jgi:hypothetical protein
VAYVYNPSYARGQDGRIKFKASPSKTVMETPISKNEPGVVVYTCNPRYAEGGDRRIVV